MRQATLAAQGHRAAVILCADDYGISEGVCRGIEELAAAGRLSATSALVGLPGWPAMGARLALLAGRIAIGLHVNLTLGSPLGPMPRLAPSGRFPSLGRILGRSLTRQLDTAEIAAEVSRQIDRFEQAAGRSPDFIDGHQHMHALPGVRTGFMHAVSARFRAGSRPLIRDPADGIGAILARGGAVQKALMVAILASGFGSRVRSAGFPTNRGFAGFSAFDTSLPFEGEIARFFTRAGPAHMVMCHPGYPDRELAGLDPVVERRGQELDALMRIPDLDKAIWHPLRSSPERMPEWPAEAAAQ